jgi:hypothetical protein
LKNNVQISKEKVPKVNHKKVYPIVKAFRSIPKPNFKPFPIIKTEDTNVLDAFQ